MRILNETINTSIRYFNRQMGIIGGFISMCCGVTQGRAGYSRI
jgi:hypothetical protein